jgi:hypothetical protein
MEMNELLAIEVGRHLSHCRSIEEIKRHVEYLAALPRRCAFSYHSCHVDKPVQQGWPWYYRAVIRFCPKDHEKPERLKKDAEIIKERVRKACRHKRWRSSPWHIEGEPPPDANNIVKAPVTPGASPESLELPATWQLHVAPGWSNCGATAGTTMTC